MESGRELAPLSKDECLRLVGSVPFGRIVFTSRAMPAIRLVRHARFGEQIIISDSPDLGITADAPGTVVAYETDLIGPGQQPAWTVLAIGRARRVSSGELPACQLEQLSSWPGGAPDKVIMITADLVTGELTPQHTSRGGTMKAAVVPATWDSPAIGPVKGASLVPPTGDLRSCWRPRQSATLIAEPAGNGLKSTGRRKHSDD